MPKRSPRRRLPPGIYQNARSPFLWARVVIQGREYRSSLRTADLQEAAQLRALINRAHKAAPDGGYLASQKCPSSVRASATEF